MDHQPSPPGEPLGELPLDSELRALLEAERVPLAEEQGVAHAAKVRVWSRLESTLGLAAPSVPTAPTLGSAATSAAASIARWPLVARLIGRVPGWAGGALVGALLVGGAWLLVAHRSAEVMRAPVLSPTVGEPASIPAPSVAAAPAPAEAAGSPHESVVPAASLPIERVRAARPRAASHATPSPSAGDLAAERALLDQARAQLRDGLGGPALATLRAHQRRFPRGQLVEERESLRIRALLYDGQTDRANELLTAFRRRYPHSIFFPDMQAGD